MNRLLDILKGIIYLIVSLIIIFVLGIVYLGFVIFVLVEGIFKNFKQKIQ